VGKRLADRQPGESVRVAFFRQDTLRVAEVVLGQNPEEKWDFACRSRRRSRPAASVAAGWAREPRRRRPQNDSSD
jgi:predicted metalloprotease with PDZ domain